LLYYKSYAVNKLLSTEMTLVCFGFLHKHDLGHITGKLQGVYILWLLCTVINSLNLNKVESFLMKTDNCSVL